MIKGAAPLKKGLAAVAAAAVVVVVVADVVVVVDVDVDVDVVVDVGKKLQQKLQHGLRLFRLLGSERKAHNVRPRPLRTSDCRQTPEQTRRPRIRRKRVAPIKSIVSLDF